MITIQPQEVWYANFPYAEDSSKFKRRPVIVLDVDNDSCTVLSMKITSRNPRSEFEIEIFDWATIPLDHISTADAASVQNIPKSSFDKRVGRLSDDDWDNVTDLYYSYLKSIGAVW